MSDEANTAGEATQGNFDALLAEIGTDLAKALPKDPETDADGNNGAEGEAEAKPEDNPDQPETDDEAPGEMKKSFTIKLESGEEIEAVDGAELIKSFSERIERNEAGVGKLLTDFKNVVVAQGDMIKSLQAKVDALGATGTGRKAVVSIAEKPAPAADLAKSEQPGAGSMTGEEFLAKALAAQAAGRLTSVEVATAESFINAGKAPPAHIQKAVLADA